MLRPVRYESSLAIVIHLDPEGDSKLKNWGRDLSVSILPIHGDYIPRRSQTISNELYVFGLLFARSI